jgi:hypothetical protein
MTFSPNFAWLQIDNFGTLPFLSNPRKSHDLVVCNLRPLFGNTDIAFGCSETQQKVTLKKKIIVMEN